MISRDFDSDCTRVTDTALGTIRSLEAAVQGFEERAIRLETDIADARKRTKELDTKVGAAFEKEEHFQQLRQRQSDIEEQLDLTKNQAPSQVEVQAMDSSMQNVVEAQKHAEVEGRQRKKLVRI